MSARTCRRPNAAAQPQSFLDCLRYFLTPQVLKEARCHASRYEAIRWKVQPLLLVLLTMTWCAGDSTAERFETAKAFYIASYQRQRRPGKTVAGFQKALARLPSAALRGLAAALRRRLARVFADRLVVDGFIPLGCDGSQLNCPRSPELMQRLRANPRPHDPPVVSVSAVVHLSLGLLWSWRLGGPRASEPGDLVHLLASLPRAALIVTDAGYVGFALLQRLVAARRWFLIRLNANAPLYTAERVAFSRQREGLAYYWPQQAQADRQAPVAVRVLRLRGKRGAGKRQADVWLMTNVLDAAQLPLATASKFYRWRWRNEGLFRTYKRTLRKVKLLGRSVAQVHREAEGSLLAVQLLLAQGILAAPRVGLIEQRPVSARQVLLEIRAEIRNGAGSYLARRRQPSYRARVARMRLDRRRHRRNQVRRRWPARKNHKPPKPPRIQRMGTTLKGLLQATLGRQ